MEANSDSQRSPVRIRLQRGRCYSWEIQIHGPNVDETLAMIRDADTKLRNEYEKCSTGA